MPPRIYHSTFTPSDSDPEILEKIFVARETLASNILEGIRESATSGNKHNRLLIGPRGIGKTHLVAMTYHRIRGDQDLYDKLCIAWLNEDPYFASYADLLFQLVGVTIREYGRDDMAERLDAVLDVSDSDTREQNLEAMLLELMGDKTLLILMENLDDILQSIRQEGQRKFRAFIQNSEAVTILATSTSLIEAISKREETFFGFFRLTSLEPLTVEGAQQLLARMAELNGDDDLKDAVMSAMGRARIRAVHYLAGGSPRIYVALFGFLTRDALDELVGAFLKLLDELTPYYQAHMSRLPPLQRRIIDVMRRFRGAATVSDIARKAMSENRTVSKQLGLLRELGYVSQVATEGRSSYYEMREPLMRLCLEMKEQRGKTVGLFVEFLRIWYGDHELNQLALVQTKGLRADYLNEAIRLASQEDDPILEQLLNSCFQILNDDQFEQALEQACLALERAPKNLTGRTLRDESLYLLGRYDEAITNARETILLEPSSIMSWQLLIVSLGMLGNAFSALETARITHKAYPESIHTRWIHMFSLLAHGQHKEAMTFLAQEDRKTILSTGYLPQWIEHTALAHYFLGDPDKAIIELETFIKENDNQYSELESLHGALLFLVGDKKKGKKFLNKAIKSDGEISMHTLKLALFSQTSQTNTRSFLKTLLKILARHIKLESLNELLLDTLEFIHTHQLSEQEARAWVQLCQETMTEYEELSMALRMLEASVDYIFTRDKTKLLQLPAEERGIFEDRLLTLLNDKPDEDPEFQAFLRKLKKRLKELQAEQTDS